MLVGIRDVGIRSIDTTPPRNITKPKHDPPNPPTYQVLGAQGRVLERSVGHVEVGAVAAGEVLLRLVEDGWMDGRWAHGYACIEGCHAFISFVYGSDNESFKIKRHTYPRLLPVVVRMQRLLQLEEGLLQLLRVDVVGARAVVAVHRKVRDPMNSFNPGTRRPMEFKLSSNRRTCGRSRSSCSRPPPAGSSRRRRRRCSTPSASRTPSTACL